MERKTFSKVQIFVRDSYNRAGQLMMSGNYAGAIAILADVVRKTPDVPQLFERLRECEVAYCKKAGAGSKLLGTLWAIVLAPVVAIWSLIDPVGAMAMCEGPLALNVDNPMMLNLLATAADRAGAPWVSATALNVIRIFHPNNEANLRRLAYAMQENQQAREALKLFQTLARKSTNSLAVQNELREAMALASIEQGKWDQSGTEKGSGKRQVADAQEAVLQQLLEGTIHDADQARVLIEKFEGDLKSNDSVDMRRKLADAYMIAEEYEKAYDSYKLVGEKLGVVDPVLDKQIEEAYIALLGKSIHELEAHPEAYEAPEQQIAELKKEQLDYRFRHTKDRATRFPNDMQLQFDLAELYFEQNMIDEAQQLFLHVSEFPQKHRASLVYLGRCALLRNDGATAAKYLDEAIKDMYRLDKYKREALYYLGNACELIGDGKRALESYRLIQTSMPEYRDIVQRIAALEEAAAN